MCNISGFRARSCRTVAFFFVEIWKGSLSPGSSRESINYAVWMSDIHDRRSLSQFPQNYNLAICTRTISVECKKIKRSRRRETGRDRRVPRAGPERSWWMKRDDERVWWSYCDTEWTDGWMYGRWPGHEMKNNRMHLMSDCLLCSYYGHLSYR